MARNTTKTKLEKMVSKLPIAKHKGRQRIDTNLYYDFNRDSYYYCLGKDENRKNKWHTEKDPVAMEQFISDIEKIGGNESIKKSLYFNNSTLEEYLTVYIDHHCLELEESTKKSYISAMKRICDEDIGIGDKIMSSINVDDIKNYLLERREISSPTTTKKDYHLLNMAFTQAIIERKLSYNPVPAAEIKEGAHSKTRQKPKANIKKYSAEEASRITQICLANLTKNNKYNNEDPNNVYAWGILISLWTGMRRSELLGLKFHDIFTHESGKRYFSLTNARTIECKGATVSLLKTENSARNCSFTPEIEQLVQFIEERYEHDKCKPDYVDNKFIIAYSDGSVPNVSAFTKGCKTFLQENGIEKPLHFHCLRHTFRTLLINSKKIKPYDLYKLMGHSNFSTTERYYIGKDDYVDFDHLDIIDKIVKKQKNTGR